jgi:EF hand
MRGQALVVGISFAAVVLSCLVHEAAAQSQQGMQAGQTQQGAQQVQPEGGMMGGRMMGGGMMGGGMTGGGMMGRHDRGAIGAGMMMRMMFSLMDADGDGSISLQEFQAAHERIFRGMDQNKDGRLTMEEMQSFMGAGPSR